MGIKIVNPKNFPAHFKKNQRLIVTLLEKNQTKQLGVSKAKGFETFKNKCHW